MTMSQGPTFQSITEEVLVNLGRSVQGNHSGSTQELVKSWVRRAHAVLFNEADWIRLEKTVDIPLTADQSIYDVPDDVDPSTVARISVLGADGKEWELGWGVRPNERNAAHTSAKPLRIEVIDGDFRIYPAPSADWATSLRLEYQQNEPVFSDPNTRIVVDTQALIMKATIYGLNHYQMPGIDFLVAELERHMDNVRASNTDGETIQLGGRQSAIVRSGARGRNRITSGDPSRRTGDDWNPF